MSRATRLASTTIVLLFFAALTGLPSVAQDGPRWEVFGGYSYWRFDSKPLGFKDSTPLTGGKVSALFNLTPNLGVVGEISGGWGGPFKSYDAAIGPQFSYPRGRMTFFGQLLFGKAKTRIAIKDFVNGGQTNTGTTFIGGAGLDYDLGPHFSFRVAQADYMRTKALGSDLGNLRVSTGIVYHFGIVKGHRPKKLPAP